MANYTKNYKLIKPTESELFKIKDFNDNSDTIDGLLADKADADHNHDDVYYTKGDMDDKLRGKASSDHSHPELANMKTETWKFTLEDGTVVTKEVCLK